MESYGAILKEARERQNLDLSAIAKDTTISVHFLKALEEEKPEVFPGEPYLVGFLKTYAHYLGIESDRVVNLYRAKTIQEAPVPEGLIVQDPPKYKMPLIIGVVSFVIVALLTTIILLLCFGGSGNDSNEVQKNVSKKYELTDKPLQTRLYKGDQLVLSSQGKNVILTVAETAGSLCFETPVGRQYIDLSDEVEIDIDNDKVPDLIAYLSDIAPKDGDESRGAEIRIMLRDADSAAIGETDESELQSVEEVNDKIKSVVHEDTRTYPFTLIATFRGGTVFRYRTDNKDTVEEFITSGEEVRMTASNKIRYWVANGGAVKLQLVAGSKIYDLGVQKAGSVVVDELRWTKKDPSTGKHKIVNIDVD